MRSKRLIILIIDVFKAREEHQNRGRANLKSNLHNSVLCQKVRFLHDFGDKLIIYERKGLTGHDRIKKTKVLKEGILLFARR